MKRQAVLRNRAYYLQNGRCFYCDQPMWLDYPEHFAHLYGMSLRQAAAFRCTAEHLLPQRLGGKTNRKNIVAACFCCNRRRADTPDWVAFKVHVLQRVRTGRWHQVLPSISDTWRRGAASTPNAPQPA